MKLTRLTTGALMALATTLALHAGTEMTTDHKDMKQMSQTNYGSDAGFYIAAYGGANFSTDYGNRHASLGGTSATPENIHSEVGGVGGIKGGYNFESFEVCNGLRLQPAVEGEALYIGMGSKFPSRVGGAVALNDSTSWNNAAGFINGILRFKLTDSGSFFSRLTPYIGVGVGVEWLTSHTDLYAGGANLGGVSDDEVDLAAQGLVGLDYNLNSHWTIFTEYKFVDAIGASLNSGTPAGEYRFSPDQIQQNLATVGVKYNF